MRDSPFYESLYFSLLFLTLFFFFFFYLSFFGVVWTKLSTKEAGWFAY